MVRFDAYDRLLRACQRLLIGKVHFIDGFPWQEYFKTEKKALIGEKSVSLTPTETKLLHILIRSARRTVTTEYLLGRLWPLEEVFEDTLRVHVHRLRQKIEPEKSSPRYLITQRGVGYSFLPTS